MPDLQIVKPYHLRRSQGISDSQRSQPTMLGKLHLDEPRGRSLRQPIYLRVVCGTALRKPTCFRPASSRSTTFSIGRISILPASRNSAASRQTDSKARDQFFRSAQQILRMSPEAENASAFGSTFQTEFRAAGTVVGRNVFCDSVKAGEKHAVRNVPEPADFFCRRQRAGQSGHFSSR